MPSQSNKPTQRATKTRSASRTKSLAAHRERGVKIDVVRQGSPIAIQHILESQCFEDGPDPNTTSGEEPVVDLLDTDEEAEYIDMDGDLPFDDASLEESNRLLPHDKDFASSSATHDDVFQLVVRDGTCTFPIPSWSMHVFDTSTSDIGFELNKRFRFLIRLAKWLSENRLEFLRSFDFWDLGPSSLDEVAQGKPSTRQKHVPALLEMQLDKASVSRYIRNCVLLASTGTFALNELFSKSAREAWVAKSISLFFVAHGFTPTDEHLDGLHAIVKPKDRKSKQRLSGHMFEAMDFPTYVSYVNHQAGTKWSAVLANYRHRIAGGVN